MRPGGAIAFPLLPALVRPTARRERAELLEIARSIGTATIRLRAVAYDTPRFEAEALHASADPVLANWRAADLVVIENVHGTLPVPEELPGVTGSWDSWIIGSQVVRLRTSDARPSASPIARIPGTTGWVYTSVSRRDPARDLIDLWTSRNRVARVHDAGAIGQILDELERSPEPRVRDGALGTPEATEALRQILADPVVA